jgi:hypothetical protein
MAPTEATAVMAAQGVVEEKAATAEAVEKLEDSSSFPAEMVTAETAAMVATAPRAPMGTTPVKGATAAPEGMVAVAPAQAFLWTADHLLLRTQRSPVIPRTAASAERAAAAAAAEMVAVAATEERVALAGAAVRAGRTTQGPAPATEGRGVMVELVSMAGAAAAAAMVETADPVASAVTPPAEVSRFSPAQSR